MSGATAWTVFGILALEAVLLIAVATLVARRLSSTLWQRTIWQACFVALLGLLALEATGRPRAIAMIATRDAGRKEQNAGAAPPKVVGGPREGAGLGVRVEGPFREPERRTPARRAGELESRRAGGRRSAAEVHGLDVRPQLKPESSPSLLRAFAFSWLMGALVVLLLNAAARFRFALLLGRSRRVLDPAQVRRVEELAGQLGLTRRVRLFESARLVGPVACGILRPAIGLPPRFDQEHTPAEQDAMLAHEAAHLAAGDPAWYLLADVLGALLWWHPFVWWARRQLHAASETAADEASLLVRDGPGVLAESLVALGARLDRQRPAAWLGIEGAGFRSGLARRVERLLKISGRKWSPPGRARAALARTLVPAALIVAVILCTAWTVPQTSTSGENMKHPHWKRSLGLLALVSVLTAAEEPATAADAPKPSLAKARPAELASTPVVAVTGAKSRAAADLQTKLESIVLDEIHYDSLPLGEVIKSLMKDAAARDPEKVGVNFLFGQPAEPIRPAVASIDPATGLPVAGGAPPEIYFSATTIRIDTALKKVRLIDALDAIVRVADQPIQYSVEGYAVVLTLDGGRINSLNIGLPIPPPPPTFQTRAFKVDTNTFYPSLKKMFSYSIDPASGDGGGFLRDIFQKLGVKLGSDCLVIYNPVTAVLLVRAPQAEFATIQAAVETLGGSAGAPVEAPANSHGVPAGLPVAPRR